MNCVRSRQATDLYDDMLDLSPYVCPPIRGPHLKYLMRTKQCTMPFLSIIKLIVRIVLLRREHPSFHNIPLEFRVIAGPSLLHVCHLDGLGAIPRVRMYCFEFSMGHSPTTKVSTKGKVTESIGKGSCAREIKEF